MEKDKIKRLRQEFKNYIICKFPDIKRSTIDTYIGDAFYVYRHEQELNINFFDLFNSLETISEFRNKLLEHQKNNAVKYPNASTCAYICGLNRLYSFFEEKYGGVDNFINS